MSWLARIIKSQTVNLNPNQILTKELSPDMKQWKELIRENVLELGGHRDSLPACLAHMLYCAVAEEQYNLAYFFIKRIECAIANPTANPPYGKFLTHNLIGRAKSYAEIGFDWWPRKLGGPWEDHVLFPLKTKTHEAQHLEDSLPIKERKKTEDKGNVV
ncbi:hypothetical protein Tco_0715366 [Tanacetum coccineum]